MLYEIFCGEQNGAHGAEKTGPRCVFWLQARSALCSEGNFQTLTISAFLENSKYFRKMLDFRGKPPQLVQLLLAVCRRSQLWHFLWRTTQIIRIKKSALGASACACPLLSHSLACGSLMEISISRDPLLQYSLWKTTQHMRSKKRGFQVIRPEINHPSSITFGNTQRNCTLIIDLKASAAYLDFRSSA